MLDLVVEYIVYVQWEEYAWSFKIGWTNEIMILMWMYNSFAMKYREAKL